MSRIEWIDSMKGIGIALIMLSHAYSFGVIGDYIFFGYIPLFFICSGFTVSSVQIGFLKKRLARLGKPYLLYGGGVCLLTYVCFNVSVFHSLQGLIYSRYCLYPIGKTTNYFFLKDSNLQTFWFLSCMMLAYIWFDVYLKSYKKMFMLGIYLFLTVCFSQFPILMPWSLDTSFLASIFIIVGYEIRQYDFKTVTNRPSYFLSAILLFLLIVYYNGGANISVASYGHLHVASVLLFTLGAFLYTYIIHCICFSLQGTAFARAMAIVGRNSLQLMCMHLLFFALFKKYVSPLIVSYSTHFFTSVVMVLVTTLLIVVANETIFNKKLQ